MQLFSREVGSSERTVIILHGLYGVSDNWMTIANNLSEKFRVILPDQRNHGRSPHHPEHTYEALATDLLELIDEKGLQKVILVGHSMGGKTAMRFALDHSELVEHMVVIDIAPKDYSRFANYAEITANHDYMIDAMLSVDPTLMANRSEIDYAFKKLLPSKTLRQFLMKNIRRSTSGKYQWQLNLEALKTNLPEIMDGFSKDDRGSATVRSEVPSLFIKGGQSPYIKDEDSLIINRFFPKSQIVTIPNAGHWLHTEQPELFLKTLLYFLD